MCGWDVFKILAVPGDTYFPPALRGIRDVYHDGVAVFFSHQKQVIVGLKVLWFASRFLLHSST